MPKLQARIRKLESKTSVSDAWPSIWVQAISDEEDSQEVRDAHVQAARDAYLSEHGKPIGEIGVIHVVVVTPKARPAPNVLTPDHYQ